MPNPDDLKARLLAMYSHRGDGVPTQYVNPDGPEAVARIEELERQNKDLREALAWYAEQSAGCRKIGAVGDPFRRALDADGGKRALAALTATNPEGESA